MADTLSDADDTTHDDSDLTTWNWERHPADVARLIFALAGFAVAAGFMAANPDGMEHLGRSLINVFALLPDVVKAAATGLAQVLALVAPVTLLGVLAYQRRIRLVAIVVAAAGLSIGAVFGFRHWLDITSPPIPDGRSVVRSWVTGSRFPSAPYLAAAAAIVTVIVPMLPRRWQRTAWYGLVGLGVLRLTTAVAVPTHVVTVTLLGISIGSAILLVTGAPRRRFGVDELRSALERAGFSLESAQRVDDELFTGVLLDGTEVHLRVIDRDQRDVDLLYRVLTAAQRRGVENERFAWSPSLRVDHEALVSLLARQDGVPVEHILGVAKTDDQAGVLILTADVTTALRDLPETSLSDEALDAVWAAVAALHDRRISHGRLNCNSLRLSSSGSVTIADLSRATQSADATRLAMDVAELLVATALVVGPARAVAAAHRRHPEGVGPSLPYLQPLALTPETRVAVKAAKDSAPDLLPQLRAEVQEAAEVEEVQMAELQRITLARAMSLFGTVVLAYIGLMFVSNWASISAALRDANWNYLPVILIMAAITYPTGAMSMLGAVTGKLPFVQSTQVMLGQAFLNRFTPANIGGMAMRTRYLQNHGIDLAVSAASIGLTSMASGIAQVFVIIGFVLWSGSGETGNALGFSLPDISTIALGILVILVAGAVVWLTPLRRRILEHKLALSVAEVFQNLRELAKRPSKLALLFGGVTLGKLATIVAFSQSCRALGIDLPFAQIGALYMGANTVASAAPTPGGVGAMEAALVAVLTGAGVEPATALSAVLVFRLATYWLPVPPSWLALRHLRKQNVV